MICNYYKFRDENEDHNSQGLERAFVDRCFRLAKPLSQLAEASALTLLLSYIFFVSPAKGCALFLLVPWLLRRSPSSKVSSPAAQPGARALVSEPFAAFAEPSHTTAHTNVFFCDSRVRLLPCAGAGGLNISSLTVGAPAGHSAKLELTDTAQTWSFGAFNDGEFAIAQVRSLATSAQNPLHLPSTQHAQVPPACGSQGKPSASVRHVGFVMHLRHHHKHHWANLVLHKPQETQQTSALVRHRRCFDQKAIDPS